MAQGAGDLFGSTFHRGGEGPHIGLEAFLFQRGEGGVDVGAGLVLFDRLDEDFQPKVPHRLTLPTPPPGQPTRYRVNL